MVKNAILLYLWLFCSELIFATAVLFGGGFMIPPQTARALSLGNAVTAGVNDPSAVYHNPAALGEVEALSVSLIRHSNYGKNFLLWQFYKPIAEAKNDHSEPRTRVPHIFIIYFRRARI